MPFLHRFINELKLCVTENTRTCGTQDYGRIYQTQRRTLHHFRGYKEGCVDVFQCASTFDSLARQIRDLGDDENSNRTAGTINKTPQEPPPRAPGLTELCANVRRAWGCLQNGLKSLPAFRRNILQPVYSAAWEAVEERCSNTKILTCYYCKKLTNFGFCKSRTQKCSHKEQACYVEEKILGNKREYTAKCIKPKHCNNGDGNGPKDSACCYDNKCNVDSLIGGPDVNAPEICDYGLSLECALDFTRTYIRSDNFSCSSAMADLRCIQEHRVTCGAGNKLYKAATEIFLKLATSSCVLDSNDPEDCYSLSIFSMQTMLSNAFSSQGNTVCVGLNETQASVKSMISSNQCSSAGAANLEQMLSFVETIVSSYCQQDQCISVPSTSPLIGNTECSGKIFEGIKLIYQAYSELEKNNDDVDCGILVISAASARTLLESCTLSPLVWKKLDALDKEVDSQCKPDRSLQIPEGCLNICNSKAFYNFTAQVSASLTEVTANDTSSCWHLTQLETAYNSLTVGCTSVQQADISAWVFSSMYSTINECKQIIPTFTFDLPLREDIYYEAVMCKANLKTGLEKAFADKDNQKLCDVIAAFNGCDINLPTSVVNLIIGSTRELVKSLEDMNVCGSSTTSGTDTRTVRQDLGYCYNLDFAAVIRELNSLPDIVTATMDTRDEACRNSDEIVARAKKASTDCSDRLPPVFKDALDILVEHIVERNSKLCLDLHYEDQQCDLDKIDKCWSDFDTICLYAALADGTLCRRAKFALECTYRFTQNCSGSDGDKAFVVRRNTKAQVRRIVGNNCPLLTAFLFCNGDVDSVHPACQLEADSTVACAEGIIDNYWSSAPMSEKCPALKANVNCVKTAVTGCEKGAVDKASWAKRIPTITTGLCGIDDFKLNDVCTSRDRCDNSLMVSCVAGQLNTCGAIINATGCVDNLLKKDRCYWDSLQSWLVMRLMEQKGITTMLTCGQQFTIPRPRRFDNTCLNSTLHTIREALHSTLGTDAQALYSTLEQFKLCLAVEVNAVEAVASRLLYDTISLITLPAGGPFVFNESDVFVDTENCAYTEAIACIEYELASILTVKLATPKEKDMLCNSVYQSTTAKCVKRALNGCPKADIERFQNIQAVSQGIVESLNICGSPKLCIISEAYVCVNKYGAALTAYDNSQELKELCMAKFAAEECLEMFTGSCSSDDSKPVKAEFDKLQSRVNEDCDKVELPRPPICPEIPEKSRVCRFGNSFRCMTNFNVRIMNGGDSLVWRQQCSNLQNMMACVATNTTSCDAESEDVETILDSLDALKASAADRCPWLTQDMCSREKPCPVATAGCEITLEKGLINSEKTVCELRDDAYACVAEYSTTCNAAQKAQAISVMDRKLESVGLPKELSCAEGSLDGLVYAALSAVRGFGVVSTVEETCKVIRAKVDNLTAEFNKESRGQFLTAGHTLLGHLRNALCEDGSACTSEQMPTVRATTYLISNMMLNDNFKMSAFCAQASEVALEISSQGCLMGFQRSVTTRNDLYPSNCQYKDPACNVIDAKIESCFSTINGMNKTVCQIAKERARCVSSFAISTCPKNETWFQPTCNTTVYLQSVDRSSTEMYISEAGSPTVFLWKLAGGNSDFYIKVESGPVKDSDVPRCLKGSRIDEPIPQVYFPYPSQRYSTEGDNVTITINARQDLRIDGNQEVELYFKVVPLTVKIMDNNEEFAKEEESEAYFLPSVKIFVEDRDLPQSTCSSINDPHLQTFDNIDYNVMDTGSFVLYRNIEYATAVVAEFKQCAKYGTCNCAVTVFASRVRFIYDLCDKDSENVQLTPDPANSAPDEQNEMLRVFKGDDMRTTYVVLVETGTVVTIKSDGEYINLWIMPSPRDFDKTQGLCGVFDGDGYNDFEMPDFSQYSLSDAENEDGVLSPVNFTSKWRRTSSQVENLVDIFAPNVEQKFAADSAFVDWTQDNVTTAMWGPLDHIAYCGFVEGEDITNKLVEAYNQNAIPRTRRRRKRQAENAETPEEINTPVAKWPTPSGRTKEDATSLCLNELSTQALEKCTAALFSIENIKKKPNFMKSVDNCVDDIRLSDSTIWVNRSKEAINQLCLVELSKDPEYQKNQTASDLAVAFTNMTCSPSDCNRKGTCYRGQCRCEADFVGTGCQHRVTNIPVPKLVAPEDGFSMCQMGLNSNCSAVYITGQNFVDSRFLTCHFREVEITETGLSHVPGSKFERKGELISVDQVRCSYGERRSTKRTLEVSVSNDGQQEYPDYQLFIAYDPVCHSCDGNTCIEKDNVCTIGNKCVRAGDVSVYDDCFFCDPNQPTKWSIRGDLAHCKQHLDDAKDDDGSHILRNALIGAGCAVLMLVILLAVAIYLLAKRRKSNRRERRDDPPSYDNSSYSSDVFHGQPIPAYNRDYFLEKPRNPNSP
ncbi:uncharacterized protein LOC101851458 [Aplysia californica]|uniref:Uncharacterized protein LOC101851458 n=1 Tax=Aplysia californica TaxID=6500 RepID=A0ABM0JB88_APLCA|nr:uncharacterized protein LOC101851458 [Aplysia californica]